MILYHGSIQRVERPEIRTPNRPLDYGAGFYMTTSYEQAEKWVKRKLKAESTDLGYVNSYDYNLGMEPDLNVLSFSHPDESWLDFVMSNRMDVGFSHSYDIVRGPVADDRVYAAFALYESRLYDKQQLINELRAYKLVDQVLIHTERALPIITFVKSEEITI